MNGSLRTDRDARLAPRRYSTPSIGARVMTAASEAFKKRGFAQAHILANWTDIAGPLLAEYCAPERLAGSRGIEGATLTIRADGPVALELRHLEPQIIERINAYYGYRAVARLKLIQGPLPVKSRPARRRLRPLTAAERQALAQSLDFIDEPPLKTALEKLGERILGTSR